MMIHWLISIAFAQPSTWSAIPVCQDNVSICETIYTAQPKPTRNPALLRFTDPELSKSKWIPLHIERLLDSNTPEPVQLALITLVQQSDIASDIDSIESRLLPLFEAESPELRAAMTELLPQLTVATQRLVISALIQDKDWLVRAQTMRIVARHLGRTHSETLIYGLMDEHSEVRQHAVKGLGWNDVVVPLTELSPLLQDTDPNVRLHTLRTIERLYPGSAVKLRLLDSLLDDSDPKVQREILRIQTAH